MKITDNLYVKVRKLWNALFGKNGDGSEIKLIKGNPTTSESDPYLAGLEIDGEVYQVLGNPETLQEFVSEYMEENPDAFEDAIAPLIAPEWDETEEYKIGILLSYLGKLYRTKKDAPAGTLPTNTEYFEEVSVAEVIGDLQTGLENGTIVPEKAKNAENLTPVSDNSGVSQDQAFILEGTGTGNGLSVVDTGSISEVWEKRGKTLVIDQKFNYTETFLPSGNNNSTHTKNGTAFTLSVNSNNTESYGAVSNLDWKNRLVVGHKYFLAFKFVSRTANDLVAVVKIGNGQEAYGSTLGWVCGIGTYNTGANPQIVYGSTPSRTLTTDDSAVVDEIICLDLSIANFTSDELADIEAHPENFFRYYQGDLSYGTRMVNSNGQIVKTTGRNAFDEVMESGNINQDTGENFAYASSMRSKNYIRVIPNRKYYYYCPQTLYVRFYDKDKNYVSYSTATNGAVGTIPPNVVFMRFVIDITTYNNNITISLAYYKDQAETILEDGYNEYYPYEELDNVDTGSEELLAFDVKKPSGLIEHNTGNDDFSDLQWTYHDPDETRPYGYFEASASKPSSANSSYIAVKAVCKYTVVATSNVGKTGYDKTVAMFGSSLFVADSSLSSSNTPTGSIQYELASPTAEQGTPFAPSLNINDFGQIEVSTPSGTTFNGVPMGNEIFYPVDYKNSLDTLINYLDGDMTNVAKADEITDTALADRGYNKTSDLSSSITTLSSLSFDVKAGIRIGNFVCITLRGQNTSGDSIASGTAIATLPSNLRPSVTFRLGGSYINNTSVSTVINNSTGEVMLESAIGNNNYVYLSLCYIIA